MSSSFRHLAAIVLLAILIAPLSARPAAQAASAPAAAPARLAQNTPTELSAFDEKEGSAALNNTPQTASAIGLTTAPSWRQQVQGTIGTSTDVDYFKFTLSQPASSVRLGLSGLTADYDLMLATLPDQAIGFDPGQAGLENVAQVGGSIAAIGGSIAAIGGSIAAIGGSIAAIGGSIAAISANSGIAAEQIESQLWMPGTYYAVVSTSNGAYSDSFYALSIEVSGSGLAVPPQAPEVELRLLSRELPAVPPAEITTLYIVNQDRMTQRYPGQTAAISSVVADLRLLSGIGFSPPDPNGAGLEWGAVISLEDLKPKGVGAPTLSQIYQKWDDEAANPLAANYVASLIDNVIEAATTDGISGNGTTAPYFLGLTSTTPLISFPNVRNIVLIGGDDSIPGFRLPDLTTIANEADYAAYLRQIDPNTGILDQNSPQAAAQRYRMITSDNPYGSGRPYRFYGFPFFMPRLAVGRIVETPEDIANYLRNYTYSSNFVFPNFTINVTSSFGEGTKRAFVSGYDFLKDQAAKNTYILTRTGLLTEEINLLNNDRWTRSDLEREWFNGRLNSDFANDNSNNTFNASDLDLFSVNSHFDHWQVLPAVNPGGGAAGNFPAFRLSNPGYTPDRFDRLKPGGFFRNTLGYSVGCHSGYNVIGNAVAAGITNPQLRSLYQADFAQAMNRHGGNWIGNTGYGYGTADGIDYSERLSTLFTQELAREVLVGVSEPTYVGQSIGIALRNAKLRYVRNSNTLSPYDYKALHIMTLYGLPYIRAQVTNPLAPPPEDPRPNALNNTVVPLEAPAPYPPNNLGRLTRLITFTLSLTDSNNLRLIPRTGSTVIDLRPEDIRVQDEFVLRSASSSTPFPQPAVRILSGDQVGAPSLPAFAYDLSAGSNLSSIGRLRVKNVIFVGGIYGEVTNFNPQMTQVATETISPIVNTTLEPRFDAGVGIWYPDKFFNFSSVGEGDDQRDQLVTAAAQFRADTGGERGKLRPYSQMVFQVIYDDPGQNSTAAQQTRQDEQPPVIESVLVEFESNSPPRSLAQANLATVVVRAFDTGPGGGTGTGIDPADVTGVYVRNGNIWTNVTFTRREQGVYIATLPVSRGDLRVIVRVTDRAGNTSFFTAKGSFQPPQEGSIVRLPLLRR